MVNTRSINKPIGAVFFVLNGLQDGEEGVPAVTCNGRQLRDGWYFLLDGEADPGDEGFHGGPFVSRDEAKRMISAALVTLKRCAERDS